MQGGRLLGTHELGEARTRCAEQRALYRRPRETRFSEALISLRDEVARS
jgi:hypothetical protein